MRNCGGSRVGGMGRCMSVVPQVGFMDTRLVPRRAPRLQTVRHFRAETLLIYKITSRPRRVFTLKHEIIGLWSHWKYSWEDDDDEDEESA